MAIRLVLVDDHPIVLSGLEQLFAAPPDFEVVAACTRGVEAVEVIQRLEPDVAVIDLRLPDIDGIEVLRRLATAQGAAPATRVVLLTGDIDEDQLLEAAALGVRGVLLKEMAAELLMECVRKVHAGERWLENRSAGRALDKAARRQALDREVAALLTPREVEIVRLVGRGLRNAEIAERLCISEGTVKSHLHKIFPKTGVATRSALARFALEKGLG